MFGRIQTWFALAAGGAIAALLAAFHIFGQGKKAAQADSYANAEKEEEKFDAAIQAGHTAGNQFDTDSVFDVSKDPYNRANRGNESE